MESPSTLLSLSQTLALKKAQDANAVASVTANELQRLAQDLQRQSAGVLTTTSIAITQSAAREMQSAEQQIEHLKQQMRQQLSAMQQQSELMQRELQKQILLQQQQNSELQEQLMQRQLQLHAQMNQQLQPISDAEMKARLASIQGQINQQLQPLKNALNSIAQEGENLQRMTAKSWLKPVLISLSILLSISVPAWGLMHYTAGRIQGNLEVIEQQGRALQQLQSQTWGIELQEDQTGRYLIMPLGTKLESGYEIGSGKQKKSAVKLVQK
jgi:DNA polymerase III alpha subunit (gram-positive type)